MARNNFKGRRGGGPQHGAADPIKKGKAETTRLGKILKFSHTAMEAGKRSKTWEKDVRTLHTILYLVLKKEREMKT